MLMKFKTVQFTSRNPAEKYLFIGIPYLCTNATPPEGVVFFFFYNKQEEDL
jgi:hypothetical protein